jgi:vancomycin resistance protein YoaR
MPPTGSPAALASAPGSAPPAGDRRSAWLSRNRLIVAAVVLVLLAAGGIGAYFAYSGEVARGVHVLGVDLGGATRAEAASRLQSRLASRTEAEVPIKVGETTAQVQPEAVGLRLDVDATVAKAAGVSPNPLTALFGRHDVAPVVTVDSDKLAEALKPHVGEQAVAAVQPAIKYEQLTPVPVYPTTGVGLDPQRAVEAVQAGWLRDPTIDVPLTDLAPKMSREEIDALVRDLAVPAVAAPVTVSTPGGEFQIAPAAIAGSLVLTAGEDGRINPTVDAAKLRQLIDAQIKGVEKQPVDAKIVLRDGAPAILPHTDGQTVDPAALATSLLGVLGQPAPRKVTAALAPTPAKLTTAGAQQLGVKERISSFTTNFVAGQPRVTNIKKIADTVRGTLVLPGATFSINAIVGERTRAKGYVDAPGIEGNGQLVNSPGGGVSQFATTTFNAMYYGGFQDVQHRPHSYYFSRYPSVIEATLYWPDLDLKWKNDSQYGVLVDTSYTNTSLTVSMWSTKRYDIETIWGPRTNPTQPVTKYIQGPGCIATDGIPGFSQEAWRVFKQGGKEIRRQRFFHRYDAEPRFICGPPPG